MRPRENFCSDFELLTGHGPFPWQQKLFVFHYVDDEKGMADRVTRLALGHKNSGQRILAFLRKLDDVEEVTAKLSKAQLPVQKLTGTLRGPECDDLARGHTIVAGFLWGT